MLLPHNRRPIQPQASVKPTNAQFQPTIRPDFMGGKPQMAPRPKPTTPLSNFDIARRQLANPYENHGKLTELQKTQLGWEKRTNPLGIQQELHKNARIYGADAVQPLTPPAQKRPINYNRRGF